LQRTPAAIAFYNTNGLTQAVSKAIEEGSNYYTLTYSPSNVQWDERFRTIKVKVTEPGVQLTYRNGYYAVDPNDRNKVTAGCGHGHGHGEHDGGGHDHGGPTGGDPVQGEDTRPGQRRRRPVWRPTRPSEGEGGGPFKEYGVTLCRMRTR